MRITARTLAVFVLVFAVAETVNAAGSSWSPTLLVNTEAFETIDSGDGSSNIELRFGTSTQTIKFLTTSRFQFSHSISVLGTMSGTNLRVDNNADVWGTLGVSGATVLKSTLTVNSTTKVRGNLSGNTLRVDNGADIWGTLGVSGATVLKNTLTVNGNTKVRGNLSGATLRVDRNADIWGNLGVSGSTTFNRVSYTWPGSQGAANTFLKNDGAGALSWSTVTVGNSSGQILSLHPQFPNSVYYQSGATAVGSMYASGSSVSNNFYRWSSTRSSLQDYWISTRVQVPKSFVRFDTHSGVVIRIRTATTSAADNYLTFRLVDTAGSPVAVGVNANLVSTTAGTWRQLSVTGVTSGTYTPLGYITLLFKVAAKSTGTTDLGLVNVNWATSLP
jgi:cytoskeletal protein CcmA (bactofilin family)